VEWSHYRTDRQIETERRRGKEAETATVKEIEGKAQKEKEKPPPGGLLFTSFPSSVVLSVW